MSAATLDEYTSVKSESSAVKPHPILTKPQDSKPSFEKPSASKLSVNKPSINKDSVFAERTRILETVARKAQEKTLTLEETTDLYARFNRTYESNYQSKKLPQEDESWALQLLEECVQENEVDTALKTRVNGIPQVSQAQRLIQSPSLNSAAQTDSTAHLRPNHTSSSQSSHFLNDTILQDSVLADLIAEEIAVKPKLRLREAFIYDQFNFTDDAKGQDTRKNANRTFWFILGISSLLTVSVLMVLSRLI